MNTISKLRILRVLKNYRNNRIYIWSLNNKHDSKRNFKQSTKEIALGIRKNSIFSMAKVMEEISKTTVINNILKRHRWNIMFVVEGVIVILLFAVCVHFLRVPTPDTTTIETIIGKDPALSDNDAIKTIAHRGAGLDAPENSLVAFKMCNEKGINFIEFDVTLTKDCVPVVFHDDTLERMTDLCDSISEKTYEELKNIDISVKHPFSERYKGTIIPTLDETVKQLIESDQNMFIDIKDNNMQMVKVILDLYDKYPDLYLRAITTSFFPNVIYFIRRRNPRIVCSLAWRPYAFTHTSYSYVTGKGPRRSNVFYKHYFNILCDKLHEFLLPTVTYYLMGISFILLHKDAICGRTVTDWREKGVRVIAWTVNHPVEKQHFARVLKVTYMTDTLTGETTVHSGS